MRTKIKEIKTSDIGKKVTVCGWIRTVRDQKSFTFLDVNDGSTLSSLQVVAEPGLPHLSDLSTGASVSITGTLVESPGQKQKWELKAEKITLYGTCPAEEYPLQKKRHSFEFLRTIAHLRPRTNTQGAVLRVRNALATATHAFFQQKGFIYVQTPIITASDAEGGGKQFLVTTLDPDRAPKHSDGKIDFSQDFFGKKTYLTVSGQLNGETLACALSDIYTFGPTFRAEPSHTTRHLAEFWMVEPEMAFADLKDDMQCAQDYLKYVTRYVLDHCQEDLEFFDNFVEKGLIQRLTHVATSPFAHLTYTDAIDILKKSGKSFTFPVEWGADLQSEHERYLAEEHCKKPVILTDYPAKIKAFYMRANEDGKTVAAMDVLVPKIGELIGGSQREERIEILKQKMVDFGLHPDDYWWYLQLRHYGTVPHCGFGVGFERLVLFITGMENIRDVIPFPRFLSNADF
jgi:asparaginyl-tRNA synthetase